MKVNVTSLGFVIVFFARFFPNVIHALAQPQILIRDGHMYLVPAEHRNLVLVANGTGKILFNDDKLEDLVASVTKSTQDIIHLKKRLGTPSNFTSGIGESSYDLLKESHKIEELKERVTSLEQQMVGTDLSASGEGVNKIKFKSMQKKLRLLRIKIAKLERKLRIGRSTLNNPCSRNPCRHGAQCVPTLFGAICLCTEAWEGEFCESDVNECANFAGTDLGCLNGGTCTNLPGTYQCHCANGYVGVHCARRQGDCSSGSFQELCGHGTCVNQHNGISPYRCICDEGWKTDGNNPPCTVDVNECDAPHPACSKDPFVSCINLPGTFACGPCPSGYSGNGHYCNDIDECQINNGGCSINPHVECINTPGSKKCAECPPGYVGSGINCHFVGMCQINNGGCHPLATCSDNPVIGQSFVQCTCPAGYTGTGMGRNGCFQLPNPPGESPYANPCSSSPCGSNGVCKRTGNTYICICAQGFTGSRCSLRNDSCSSNPCFNGGTCTLGSTGFLCTCPDAFTGARCQFQKESCGGILRSTNGTLTYPQELSQMFSSSRSQCVWVIETMVGKVINVTFQRFNVEDTPDCRFDALEVRDGRDPSANLIGRFCGVEVPAGGSIISTHHFIYLALKTESVRSNNGFSLRWTTSNPICGEQISNLSFGSISSPGYPDQYPHNRDCFWTIAVSPGKRIHLVFATLQIEAHPNCSYDYLEIRDGFLQTDTMLAKYCNSSLPPPITSTGSYVSLLFHSDSSSSDTGFHVTFSAMPGIPGCGGIFTSPTGSLSPPQNPGDYDTLLECEWIIRLNGAEDKIELKFSSIGTGQQNFCDSNYLEIREGNSPNSRLGARYLCFQVPSNYKSSTNTLFVRFHSDGSINYKGLNIRYEAACGGTFTQPTGIIRTPFYPNHYPKNRDCIFLISQPLGKAVILQFLDLKVEASTSPSTRPCTFDYVEIRDGDYGNSTLLGLICGESTETAGSFLSTHNYLWIRFKTDGSVQNKGFLANYSTVDTSCGGILRGKHGTIVSPLHPENYVHGAACTWIIRGAPDEIIRLTWISFSVESSRNCRFDYVEVFDNSTLLRGGTSLGKFCGAKMPPTLTSMGNTLTVIFKSDSSISRDGFRMSYGLLNSSKFCGGEYRSVEGMIKSLRYPNNYPRAKSCEWTIKVPIGQQIRLNITDFDVENGTSSGCHYDYLEIRNGGRPSSPLIGKFCNTNRPPSEIPSFTNELYIKFRADHSNGGRGFFITWDGTSTGCGGVLSSSRGTITTPNYPQASTTSLNCVWTVAINHGNVIQLYFMDMDIGRCRRQYVEIRDGPKATDKLIGKYCLRNQPLMITSKNNIVRIKYFDGNGLHGRGFSMRYNTVCNRTIRATGHGIIETPNFPNPYYHNLNCSWTIKAPIGNKLNLSFSHLSLEGNRNEDCVYDYVEVIGSRNQSLGKFCAQNRTDLISTKGNVATVNFLSDHSVSRSGFRLEYAVDGCTKKMVGTFFVVYSPNYPNSYPRNTECVWTMTTELGKRIEVTVTGKMEISKHCHWDNLKIYSGEDETGSLLTTICHNVEHSETVTTTGNHAHVVFTADEGGHSIGFFVTFRTVLGGCGGKYRAREGYIQSPNFPENYDYSEDCTWLIEVDSAHTVEIKFEEFILQPHSNCSLDSVSIYDGSINPELLLGRFCGDLRSKLPVVKSTSNKMLVHMRTDSSSSAKGFRAKFTTACGARITSDSQSNYGTIASPNYKNLDRLGCIWILENKRPGGKVFLRFTDIRFSHWVDHCNTTAVSVYDGDTRNSTLLGAYCDNKIPHIVKSSGNVLLIHFINNNIGAFRATYAFALVACGGQETIEHSLAGPITSPGYPSPGYPPSIECSWLVKAPEGNQIQVSLRDLNIEENDGCNSDFLEIRDGKTRKLLGHYCGNEIGSDSIVATKSNNLWMLFRSDDRGQAPGFWVDYSLVRNVFLNGSLGLIESPNYPYLGSILMPFTWTINVDVRKVIVIEIIEQYSTFLGLNWLHIYDGVDENAPNLLPEHDLGSIFIFQDEAVKFVTTSGPSAFILAKCLQICKFQLQWKEKSKSVPAISSSVSGCGANLSITEGNDTSLMDTSFRRLPGERSCSWYVSSPPHTRISLYAENILFSGSCEFNRLEVWSGTEGLPNYSLNTTLCDRNVSPETLILPSNLMKLISIGPISFNLTLRAVCGGYLGGTRGGITSPNYPKNYSGPECSWVIIVRPGRTIKVEFQDFDVYSVGSECGSDYLTFRNGHTYDSPRLGKSKYCGTQLPRLPETSGNYLSIFFKFQTHSRKGFALTYEEVSIGCGGEIHLVDQGPSAIIASPNFPLPPPIDTECEWSITAPQLKNIQLDFQQMFSFATASSYRRRQCNIAGVEIRDGSTAIAPLKIVACSTMPGTQKSSGNSMYVRYYTSAASPKEGFKAQVKIAQCGGTITSAAYTGEISSPNYPASYPKGVNCIWTIHVRFSRLIRINIVELDINSGSNCTDDRLMIYEAGRYTENPRNWTFCSEIRPRTVSSNSDIVKIQFISGENREQSKGFKLKWSYGYNRTGCGGSFQAPSGTIQSPNYPRSYQKWLYCRWVIRAPPGRRIRVEFDEFDLHEKTMKNGELRCTDYLWLGMGYHHGRYFCGSKNLEPIETTGGNLEITFYSEEEMSHRGFKLRYNTDQASVCGGEVEGTAGSISSPEPSLINQNLTFSIVCEWMMQANSDSYNGITWEVNLKDLYIVSKAQEKSDDPDCLKNFLAVGDARFRNRKCGNIKNQKILLNQRTLNLKYLTMSFDSHFNLTYKMNSCGGVVGRSANITSLDYPNVYGTNISCLWSVSFPWGSKVKARFLDINLDPHTTRNECDRDYVLIRNGRYTISPVVGKFCGNSIPQDFISMGSTMMIEFHSDDLQNENRRGFSISLEEISHGCGGTSHQDFGYINYPKSVSGKYGNDVECEWHIESQQGRILNFRFYGRFEIEETPNCTNDYVEIFEKNTDENEWKSFGKSCGRVYPEAINTTSNAAKIIFRSNGAVQGDGFRLSWESVCGGVYKSRQGIIQSVGTPTNFKWPSDVKACYYQIIGKVNDYISIQFLEPFQVFATRLALRWHDVTEQASCSLVNVSYWHGTSDKRAFGVEPRVYCGTELPPPFTASQAVTILYNAIPSLTLAGFRVQYNIYECGGKVQKPMMITSPGHPFQHGPDWNCTWVIEAPAEKVARLRFYYLELEQSRRCNFDYVKVFEGARIQSNKLLGTYCGNMTEKIFPILSKSNTMTVQFRTDFTVQLSGFKAFVDFTLGENQGCGGKMNATSVPQEIKSPDSDGNGTYDGNLDCRWLIEAPAYHFIQLKFKSFRLQPKPLNGRECSNDEVEVYDGLGQGMSLGSFCGSSLPPRLISSGNFMWIKFRSDGNDNREGFVASIESRPSPCGELLVLNASREAKTLTSPNYPSNYDNNIRCKWTIVADSFLREVDIKFLDFDIEKSPGCHKDMLSIRDVALEYQTPEGIGGPVLFAGTSTTDPELNFRFRSSNLTIGDILQHKKYCGSFQPSHFQSVSRSVELSFSSDGAGTGKGFKLEYKLAECNKSYENSQGRILSPNYPAPYPMYLNCMINITTEEGRTIALYFNFFELPRSNTDGNCNDGSIEIRERPEGPNIKTFCGSTIPNPVFSAGNTLYISFLTRRKLKRGFDISYTTTDQGTGCGGFLYHTGGSFTSPKFPGNWSVDGDCVWTVRVPGNLKLRLEFTNFQLALPCSSNFVELFTKDSHSNAEPILLTRYCATDEPTIQTAETDMMMLRYRTSANNTANGWRALFTGV